MLQDSVVASPCIDAPGGGAGGGVRGGHYIQSRGGFRSRSMSTNFNVSKRLVATRGGMGEGRPPVAFGRCFCVEAPAMV